MVSGLLRPTGRLSGRLTFFSRLMSRVSRQNCVMAKPLYCSAAGGQLGLLLEARHETGDERSVNGVNN